MRAEAYSERRLELEGWPVNLTSYKLGDRYYSKADNVSPGALISRASGLTREEAEQKALVEARQRLARTRRREI